MPIHQFHPVLAGIRAHLWHCILRWLATQFLAHSRRRFIPPLSAPLGTIISACSVAWLAVSRKSHPLALETCGRQRDPFFCYKLLDHRALSLGRFGKNRAKKTLRPTNCESVPTSTWAFWADNLLSAGRSF